MCVAGDGNGCADHDCYTVRICQRSFNMKLGTRNLGSFIFLRRLVKLEYSITDNKLTVVFTVCRFMYFHSNITQMQVWFCFSETWSTCIYNIYTNKVIQT